MHRSLRTDPNDSVSMMTARSIDYSVQNASVLTRSPDVKTKRYVQNGERVTEKVVYQDHPDTKRKFEELCEKVLVLTLEVMTLKQNNTALKSQLGSKDQGPSQLSRDRPVSELEAELRKKDKEISELTRMLTAGSGRNVSMVMLEQENDALKKKVHQFEDSFDVMNKKFESRLLDINRSLKRANDETRYYKEKFFKAKEMTEIIEHRSVNQVISSMEVFEKHSNPYGDSDSRNPNRSFNNSPLDTFEQTRLVNELKGPGRSNHANPELEKMIDGLKSRINKLEDENSSLRRQARPQDSKQNPFSFSSNPELGHSIDTGLQQKLAKALDKVTKLENDKLSIEKLLEDKTRYIYELEQRDAMNSDRIQFMEKLAKDKEHNTMQNFKNEIENLRKSLEDKNLQLADLQHKNQKLEDQNRNRKDSVEKKTDYIKEKETLAKENFRLKNQLADKNQIIEDLKLELRLKESEIEAPKSLSRISRGPTYEEIAEERSNFNEQIKIKNRIIDDLQRKVESLQASLDDKNLQLSLRKQTTSDTSNYEKQMMTEMLEQKNKTINNLKARLTEMENTRSPAIEEEPNGNLIKILKGEIDDLNKEVEEKGKQLADFRNQLAIKDKHIANLTDNLNLLQEANEEHVDPVAKLSTTRSNRAPTDFGLNGKRETLNSNLQRTFSKADPSNGNRISMQNDPLRNKSTGKYGQQPGDRERLSSKLSLGAPKISTGNNSNRNSAFYVDPNDYLTPDINNHLRHEDDDLDSRNPNGSQSRAQHPSIKLNPKYSARNQGVNPDNNRARGFPSDIDANGQRVRNYTSPVMAHSGFNDYNDHYSGHQPRFTEPGNINHQFMNPGYSDPSNDGQDFSRSNALQPYAQNAAPQIRVHSPSNPQVTFNDNLKGPINRPHAYTSPSNPYIPNQNQGDYPVNRDQAYTQPQGSYHNSGYQPHPNLNNRPVESQNSHPNDIRNPSNSAQHRQTSIDKPPQYGQQNSYQVNGPNNDGSNRAITSPNYLGTQYADTNRNPSQREVALSEAQNNYNRPTNDSLYKPNDHLRNGTVSSGYDNQRLSSNHQDPRGQPESFANRESSFKKDLPNQRITASSQNNPGFSNEQPRRNPTQGSNVYQNENGGQNDPRNPNQAISQGSSSNNQYANPHSQPQISLYDGSANRPTNGIRTNSTDAQQGVKRVNSERQPLVNNNFNNGQNQRALSPLNEEDLVRMKRASNLTSRSESPSIYPDRVVHYVKYDPTTGTQKELLVVDGQVINDPKGAEAIRHIGQTQGTIQGSNVFGNQQRPEEQHLNPNNKGQTVTARSGINQPQNGVNDPRVIAQNQLKQSNSNFNKSIDERFDALRDSNYLRSQHVKFENRSQEQSYRFKTQNEARSHVHQENEHLLDNISFKSNMDSAARIDRIERIMAQKPFEITRIEDVPQRVLDLYNEIEGYKYGLQVKQKKLEQMVEKMNLVERETEYFRNKLDSEQDANDQVHEFMEELKALKDHLLLLENRIELLYDENKDLNDQNNSLRGELMLLREKFAAASRGKDFDIDALMAENSGLTEKLRKLSLELARNNNRMKELEEENERQKVKLLELDEIDDLKDKIKKLERELEALSQQLANRSATPAISSKELAALKAALNEERNNNERLQRMLKQKDREIDEMAAMNKKLKEINASLENKVSQLKDEIDKTREDLEDNLNATIREKEDILERQQIIKAKQGQTIENLQASNNSLMAKVDEMNKLIAARDQLVANKENKIKDLIQQLKALQAEREADFIVAKKALLNLKGDYPDFYHKLIETMPDQTLKVFNPNSVSEDIKGFCDQTDAIIKKLLEDNIDLKNLIEAKDVEIKLLVQKLKEHHLNSVALTEHAEQIPQIKKENIQLKEKLKDAEGKIQALLEEIEEYQELENNFYKLKNIASELQAELDNYRTKYYELKLLNDNLMKQRDDALLLVEQQKSKIADLEKVIDKKVNMISQLIVKLFVFTTEIERLNNAQPSRRIA